VQGMKVMDVLRDQIIHARLYSPLPDAVPVVAQTDGVVIGDKLLQLGYVVKCSADEMKSLFPSLQISHAHTGTRGAGRQTDDKQSKQRPAGVGNQISGEGLLAIGRPTGGLYGNTVAMATASAAVDGCRPMKSEDDEYKRHNQ